MHDTGADNGNRNDGDCIIYVVLVLCRSMNFPSYRGTLSRSNTTKFVCIVNFSIIIKILCIVNFFRNKLNPCIHHGDNENYLYMKLLFYKHWVNKVSLKCSRYSSMLQYSISTFYLDYSKVSVIIHCSYTSVSG